MSSYLPILMDMDMGSSSSSDSSNSTSASSDCKVSMLFNTYTIDACFLSSNWHITSKGMFAGSVIGIFFLCVLIEAVRRLGREYDRWLVRNAATSCCPSVISAASLSELGKDDGVNVAKSVIQYVPSWPHQLLRSFVYGSQFTAGFIVMLTGMYFNIWILIAIFIGQTAGYFFFGRDTVSGELEQSSHGNCC
ncbi:solute carrier family 31 (copper transporter), member 1 [Cryptococcus wingfieldii CBS 7118]|uniref:Copper transport protein n=1 Tax=Cryptococcus wingfieldii CBS 7118 TaxID=1295528 RepID=A0A1E3J678_9TREE|nr:solute carrier family 31 (copper transporter), member 1 [Cryptococcus wingfieldii CBS 7118]ODN96369.1 solute carrier family 31 (copper transporter), member 1 [Cryptococcus wingfieldii CBS 7118]